MMTVVNPGKAYGIGLCSVEELGYLSSRRPNQLAVYAADELLTAIQGHLMEKPDRGAMVPGLGGVRKTA
jgi:hypothetical protein